MSFQKRVKKLMFEKNINQRKLAKKVNMTDTSISFILSGKRRPSIQTVLKIANALDVDYQYLIEGFLEND